MVTTCGYRVSLHLIWSSVFVASLTRLEFGFLFRHLTCDFSYFFIPKVAYVPFHTHGSKYFLRAYTIMSGLHSKMLGPDSNTWSANLALAVLDQLNYLTTFLSWHYVHVTICPPIFLYLYHISVTSNLITFCFFWRLWPLSYDDCQASKEIRTLNLS